MAKPSFEHSYETKTHVLLVKPLVWSIVLSLIIENEFFSFNCLPATGIIMFRHVQKSHWTQTTSRSLKILITDIQQLSPGFFNSKLPHQPNNKMDSLVMMKRTVTKDRWGDQGFMLPFFWNLSSIYIYIFKLISIKIYKINFVCCCYSAK